MARRLNSESNLGTKLSIIVYKIKRWFIGLFIGIILFFETMFMGDAKRGIESQRQRNGNTRRPPPPSQPRPDMRFRRG